MIEDLRVIIAIVLPWAAGAVWLRVVALRLNASSFCVELGYGHFVGILGLTLLMRGYDRLGFELSFGPLATILIVLIAAGLALLALRRRESAPPQANTPAAAGDPFPFHWLAIVCAGLLVLRFGSVAIDALMRPLFPWDSWTQWGTKAKVWSQLHQLAPFIGYNDWLQRSDGGYIDTASRYPATIPLLQTWAALAIGHWDDALMNAPWLASFAALGIAIYGQLRSLAVGRPWSLFTAYAVLSLPILDAHVALTGYADFHLAAAYALAVLALMAWDQRRGAYSILLMTCAGALLPLTKIPGIAWAGTLVLGALLGASGSNWRRALAILITLALSIALALSIIAPGKISGLFGLPEGDVGTPLIQHLFLFGNWNLLWYVFPLVIAQGWRTAVTMFRGTSITLASGLAFLTWTFFFTRAGDWIANYATINRALLHIAPAATVFATLLIWKWAITSDLPRPGAALAATADSEPAQATPDATQPSPQ